MRTIAIIVKGKVQGVFFRKSTREKAVSIGLKGTVENLPDGSVFILASGENDLIDNFIRWCESGPPRAIVTEILLEERQVNASFQDFSIL
jgi:acylphosphatase